MDNVLNTTEREYYFVNEDSTHLKWIAFIGNLIGGYVVQDFVALWIVLPAFIIGLGAGDKLAYSGSDMLLYLKIIGVYTVVAFIIGRIIEHKSHDTVYVKEGSTFYIVKSSVSIDNHTKLTPSGGDNPAGYIDPYDIFKGDTNAYIRSMYENSIDQLDRIIDKKTKRAKVLLNCKEEGKSIKGKMFSGFNEETMETETFTIPNYYFKYDNTKDYYSDNTPEKIYIWAIKILMYVVIFLLLCKYGVDNAKLVPVIYENYIEERESRLAPLDYKFDEKTYNQGNGIIFIDGSYTNPGTIKYKYEMENNSKLKDFDIVIRQHMNYDAGTDRLYEIIMAAFNDATFKKSDLDEKIEEYRRTGTEEESQYPCKNGVVYISVGESNTSDYYIFVIQCVR